MHTCSSRRETQPHSMPNSQSAAASHQHSSLSVRYAGHTHAQEIGRFVCRLRPIANDNTDTNWRARHGDEVAMQKTQSCKQDQDNQGNGRGAPAQANDLGRGRPRETGGWGNAASCPKPVGMPARVRSSRGRRAAAPPCRRARTQQTERARGRRDRRAAARLAAGLRGSGEVGDARLAAHILGGAPVVLGLELRVLVKRGAE
mmetsp:Transcript_61745/g.163640  ORF Transcript_61745/g.163640 Transcript_61745/m.163640 type:complete len:202 (+) Transcript_61745:443-1048(+)